MTPFSDLKFWMLTGALLGVTAAIYGTRCGLVLYFGKQREIESSSWIRVPATIRATKLEHLRGGGIYYQVDYSYIFRDREYLGRRDNFYGDWKSTLSEEFLAENVNVVGAISAFVNPNDPSQSVRINCRYTKSEFEKLLVIYGTTAGIGGFSAFFFGRIVFRQSATPEHARS